MKKRLNLWVDLVMLVILFVIYGAGVHLVAGDNENVLAGVAVVGWIGWLAYKYWWKKL